MKGEREDIRSKWGRSGMGGWGMEDRTIWRGPHHEINSNGDQNAMAFGVSSSIFFYLVPFLFSWSKLAFTTCLG
jgi:hypothetical protein